MPWNDFAQIRIISEVSGTSYEDRGHQLEITGTAIHPVVACRTRGCIAGYRADPFVEGAPELLTGKLRAGEDERGFTITYDAEKKQILCRIDPLDNVGTTGSWTANDPGQGDGDGDKPTHRRP